jgi:phosphoribosylaminoimidazole-succinocarboxamide synthase
MSDSWVETISKRYIELYEKVIGETFHPISMSQQEIGETIEKSLQQLKTIR